MPIFDQGYQHWQGRLSMQGWRWLPITLQGARTQLKNRWVRWVILAALGPALLLSAFLALWGLFEQQSSLLTPYLMFFQGLPEALKSGPRGYRSAFWTLAFRQFFGMQLFFAMILVLLVGPDLISQDLRFNAIPLYLSRPVRRFEYFLGKLGVIALYLLVVAVVPVLVAYALGFGFSLDPTVFRDTARLLCASLAYGLIIVVSAGLLMLAFSSLSRNSRYVGAMWLGLWLVGDIASGVLVRTVRADWCPLVSYTENLDRLRDALIGAEPAAQQVMDLFNAGQEGLNRSPLGGPFGRGGPLRGRGARARAANSRTETSVSTGAQPGAARQRRLAFAPAVYPWQWSAAVLTALAAISCVILTTRVRTLDRLR
jgi:ABC-2 type transport system permease protein